MAVVTGYVFAKLCDSPRLTQEIGLSSIVTALDHIQTQSSPEETTVYFKDALSIEDEATLDALIGAHVATPLPDNTAQLVTLGVADSDGSPIIRNKTTKTGWHYEPRALDWYTSTAGSLYNRKHGGAGIDDGEDYGDAVLRFYDTAGLELVQGELETLEDFQLRLDSNCVKTFVDWQTTYDHELIGGIALVRNTPAGRAYAWVVVAPDLPEAYGGSVPLFTGGWNINFMGDFGQLDLNGRGVKLFTYDPVYNTNKIRTIIKHALGAKIGIQILFEHFKA